MTKPNWEACAAATPLYQQNWHHLRATVVWDPERRVEAWKYMTLRSWTAQGRPHHEGKLIEEPGGRNRGD